LSIILNTEELNIFPVSYSKSCDFYTRVLLTPYNSSLCFCATVKDVLLIVLVLLTLLICLLKRHFSLSLPLNMDNTLSGGSRTLLCLFFSLKRMNDNAHLYSKQITIFMLSFACGYLDKLWDLRGKRCVLH